MEIIDLFNILVEKILPIIFLIVLGIGAVICIFDISPVQHMPARRITGWLSIGSVILILVSPYCEHNPEWLTRLVDGTLILIIIFGPLWLGSTVIVPGLSKILLSRAFTYMIKSSPTVASWISAILFGFGSCVFYAVLFWFSFRFVAGESKIALAFYGILGGFAAGIISLFVNIIEKLRD